MFTFNPISVEQPPCHTKIHIRCHTCAKKRVCGLMTDYLKTATLIENILGNPQKDRAIACDWGFTGLEFDEQIFPTEIQASTNGAEETTGTYINAKYKNKDKVKLLYEIKKYFVMFTFTWDEGEQTYKLTSNKEIYFGIPFNLNSSCKPTPTASRRRCRCRG